MKDEDVCGVLGKSGYKMIPGEAPDIHYLTDNQSMLGVRTGISSVLVIPEVRVGQVLNKNYSHEIETLSDLAKYVEIYFDDTQYFKHLDWFLRKQQGWIEYIMDIMDMLQASDYNMEELPEDNRLIFLHLNGARLLFEVLWLSGELCLVEEKSLRTVCLKSPVPPVELNRILQERIWGNGKDLRYSYLIDGHDVRDTKRSYRLVEQLRIDGSLGLDFLTSHREDLPIRFIDLYQEIIDRG